MNVPAIQHAPGECASCFCAESFKLACIAADARRSPPDERTKFLRRLLEDDISLDRAQQAILRRRQR